MAATVNITKTQRGGAYADVVDFLFHMGLSLGSATNAAAVLLRNSDEYRQWKRLPANPGGPVTPKRKTG